MRISNEESSSLAIRQQGQLLEHPEDFEDDNDNDNYSDYVENVSVHAGTHIKSGVRWSAFIQIERAIAISKSPKLNPDCGCLSTQKPLRGEARRLIARLGCVIDPAALQIVENDLREGLPRPDLCAAKKCRILINHQPGRFNVTTQRATRLEVAAFSHENIALHRPSHLHRFRPDLTAYARVLLDRERSDGIDCALQLAVDEQLVQELDRAFDRNSSGEKSAGLRWHERAVGWPWGDRWSGRFV
jgi:hypothetical protein